MKRQEPQISPVYLLVGPEDFLINEEVQRLLDQTLPPSARGFNLHIFDGEEHHAREIVRAAQTLPMFSKYRFVLVTRADQFRRSEIEPLLQYIERPSPSTCLVMTGSAMGPWKEKRGEIERVGQIVEFQRLKGRSLLSWTKKRMAQKGKVLSEEAADYLVEVVGDRLYDLENALEKAFLSVGEKQIVDLADVERITSEIKMSTLFDLMDAIGHRDLEKALKILDQAMESRTVAFRKEEGPPKKMDDPVPLLLSMMARQYHDIWRAKETASGPLGTGQGDEETGVAPWRLRKLTEQGRYFSEAALREGILRCHQIDLLIKKGRGPRELLLEKLVLDLCRPQLFDQR